MRHLIPMRFQSTTRGWPSRLHASLLAAVLVSMLGACASPRNKAPVEERAPVARPQAPAAAGANAAAGTVAATIGDPSKPLPGAENAGKPGYYSVKPGDTLMRIGLEHGQNWRDVARWNGMDNPNLIEVGQVLRVAPPGADPAAPGPRAVASTKVEARPLDGRSAASSPAPGAGAGLPAAPPPVAAPAATPGPVAASPGMPPPNNSAAGRDPDEEVSWIWPANGPVGTAFDEARNKGIAIPGKAGDPVLAAADGRVVYAGSGVRGYGNVVIVKHNNTYLTAYAHNQALLVKEDQAVRRGQRIAEMGATEAERVQLHFEIRRLGKPIDPVRLLPPR